MKYNSKKNASPKKIKKATKISAKTEKGGMFKKFLGKIKK